MKTISIDEVKSASNFRGKHFFDKPAMRFFRSRVAQVAYQGEASDIAYFVSSEQFVSSRGECEPRKFSVRSFNFATGQHGTVGRFQMFPTGAQAATAARNEAIASEKVAVSA